MSNLIGEFLMILAFSKRTQWFLMLGLVVFAIINLVGDHIINGLVLSGPMSSILDPIKEALHGRYDKAALGCLMSSFLLAAKSFRTDRKRFYRYF
jgi:hypothetical protein